MRARSQFAAAIVAQLVGAAAVLLFATRSWQAVTTRRPRPFADDVLHLSGRTVDAAPTALALVALAGVVAVVATKGVVRRLVGVVVAVAGAAIVWRCASSLGAVTPGRAAAIVRDRHPGVVQADPSTVTVVAHPVWGVLSIVVALLVIGAGAAVAVLGPRWAELSSRYESPAARDEQTERARADASLWTALERGDDPTARDPEHDH